MNRVAILIVLLAMAMISGCATDNTSSTGDYQDAPAGRQSCH